MGKIRLERADIPYEGEINTMKNSSNKRPELQFPDPASVDWDVEEIDEIKSEYINVSKVMLETMEGAALRIESHPEDADTLQEIKRIIHTLKGDSHLIGLPIIGDLLHNAETLITWQEAHNECPAQFILTLKDWLSAAIHGGADEKKQWTNETAAPSEPVVRPPESFKTLIVDDNSTNRLVLRKIMEKYGPADDAVDGVESIKMFKEAIESNEPYDLICMDIMMPKMDGQEALKHIREIETTMKIVPSEGVKVIMITALNDLKNVSTAYGELCDGYIVKPIDVVSLREELGKLDLAA